MTVGSDRLPIRIIIIMMIIMIQAQIFSRRSIIFSMEFLPLWCIIANLLWGNWITK